MKLIVKFGLIVIIIFSLLTSAFVFANNYFSKKQQVTFNEGTEKKNSEDRSKKLPQDNEPNNSYTPTKIKPSIPPECNPENLGFKYEISKDNKIIKDFSRGYDISFPGANSYTHVQGVTCFRGNNYRNSASFGTVDVKEQKLETVWSLKIGSIDSWTGVGWNGQPAIIKWDEPTKNIMNLYKNKKQKSDLKEVIYATLDGKIYFLDLDNGEFTRPFIDVGAPHKGSVTIDPRGIPLLYAGQGIDEKGGKKIAIGYRIFSLINQKLLYFINGIDPYALRAWGAFDSTPLIDSKTDTIIEPGENGILYTAKLNTKYDPSKASLSINPELIKYRYTPPQNKKIGTENSIAIYKNYGYFADNGGTLQCINLNTLQPLWVRNITDDTDSTIAIDDSLDPEISLYTACEVDSQGISGYSYIRKINALTGDLIWEKSIKCIYDSNTNGGALASPVVGKNDIENLVIYNIAKVEPSKGGKLIAFDKKTGQEIWVVNLQNYCWSSPVDVYTNDGKSYLIVCDSAGNMHLIEGKSGRIIDTIWLGANIEASPAVYDNMIVVGTRGQKIWGVKIK